MKGRLTEELRVFKHREQRPLGLEKIGRKAIGSE